MQQLAAGACGLAHHTGPVHTCARCSRTRTARYKLRQRQLDVTRQPLHQAVLGGRQGIEVSMLQALNVAGRHGGVKVKLLVFLRWLGLLAKLFLWRQRLAHARATFAGLGFTFSAGHELREQFVGDFRILKIHVKEFTKYQAVLLTADHDGFKRSA